jgi:hypothetical protein
LRRLAGIRWVLEPEVTRPWARLAAISVWGILPVRRDGSTSIGKG